MRRLLDAVQREEAAVRQKEAAVRRVEETVRREADRVAREARALSPLGRGRVTQSIHLNRKADGSPYLADRPGMVDVDQHVDADALARMKDRWERTCGAPGALPIPVPLDLDPDSPFAEVIREHAERAINGGHEWVEVELSGTEQVVAWYCSRCDEQRYAEGW